MDKNSEFYPKDVYGLTKGFGTRRHYCASNEVYREYSKKIAIEMAEHYKNNLNVIAWQIDNEFGTQCYCQSCHSRFKTWVKNKYGTIDKLSDECGTVFWSHTYRKFDEIIIPM